VIDWRAYNANKNKANGRATYHRRRRRIMEKLGLKCECCGETEYKFLTIDHRNGNGNAHRRTFGKSKGTPTLFYRWADTTPKRELKKTLRTMCWNCNCAIGAWGTCPHVG
jgi:hypothetical protein